MVRGPLAQVVRGVAGTPHLPLAPFLSPCGRGRGGLGLIWNSPPPVR